MEYCFNSIHVENTNSYLEQMILRMLQEMLGMYSHTQNRYLNILISKQVSNFQVI